MKATWNNQIVAESEETIVIEANHYFPLESVSTEFLQKNEYTTECVWKGTASYYDVVVDGEINENAAWYYLQPKEGSIERVGQDFTNYVAFWKGVIVG